MAPVCLLNKRLRDYCDYRLRREDPLNGVKAWVLRISPKLAVVEIYLGVVWIRQDDYNNLKIEWDPTKLGRYESISLRVKKYKSEPQVRSYTRFEFEKNEIRFPSTDFTE